MILGIDEVGRGAWAGPLVVGAVVLNEDIEGLNDSKLLSAKKRDYLAKIIYSKASVGLGWVAAEEIDSIGLAEALKLATVRAVEGVKSPYHEIIIDGTVNFLDGTVKGGYVTNIKKADQLISAVSAASIVAKVARDNYMKEQHLIYPDYRFDLHVGYGTALHRKILSEIGSSSLHRKSYKPIQKLYSTKDTAGFEAEELVASFLKKSGHKLLDRNWKTKYCEIDIVSSKDERLYFTEVKYRKNDYAGDGLAAITPQKLKKMHLASRLYVSRLEQKDFCLAVASVSGSPMHVDVWLEID